MEQLYLLANLLRDSPGCSVKHISGVGVCSGLGKKFKL